MTSVLSSRDGRDASPEVDTTSLGSPFEIISHPCITTSPEPADASPTFSSPELITVPMAAPNITNTTDSQSTLRAASHETELEGVLSKRIYGLSDLQKMRYGARNISLEKLNISKEAPPGKPSPKVFSIDTSIPHDETTVVLQSVVCYVFDFALAYILAPVACSHFLSIILFLPLFL